MIAILLSSSVGKFTGIYRELNELYIHSNLLYLLILVYKNLVEILWMQQSTSTLSLYFNTELVLL